MALKSLTHDQNKVNQQTSGEVIWKVLLVDSNGDPVTLGFTNLTEFVSQTAWRVFYSDSLGDVTELALGADGTFLKSNGASSAPTFATPAGSGDVTKVGTPVNNQIGVWTGDGTIEGDADLTWDGSTLLVSNDADSASVQTLILEGDRATMADNDEAYITLRLSDDGGTQTEIARLTWVATDVNAGTSEDSRLDFSVMTAGTLAKELQLDGTALSPTTTDGLALGTTLLNFSDLFLDSGAVINFDGGNVTITHSANTLTLAGGELNLGANLLKSAAGVAIAGDTGNLSFYADNTYVSVLIEFGSQTIDTLLIQGQGTAAILDVSNIITTDKTFTFPNASGTFLTDVSTASALTSLGTLTALQVDNININGNTISSTAGTDLLITPLAGQQIVLDGTIVIDAGVVTGATSITSTDFVGALTGTASGNLTTANISDTAYASSWDGVTTIAPSKNAVYDKIETLDTREISLFQGVMLDATGDAFIEPYSILATNDLFRHAILRLGANNAAAPTVKSGFYGRVHIPDDYNGGTVTLDIFWTSTLTTGDVVFDFDYRAIGGNDTESLDQTTYQESLTGTDTAPSAANERQKITLTITAANLAADDTLEFFFGRDGADAADTLAGSALVHEVILKYTANA